MAIFNDPGVYVVQTMKPAPLTPVMPARPSAFIGPMYQVVDQEAESDTNTAIFLEEGGDAEAIVMPYPSLISAESEVDLSSVKVKLFRKDGRIADITALCEINVSDVTLDLTRVDVMDELHILNDDWGGKSDEGDFIGINGAKIHIEYRALRSDLVGRVLAAQGADGVLATIGKASHQNPLGLAGGIAARLTSEGMYFVPTSDDVDGDIDMALALLEPLNVYSPVALSANPLTQQAVIAHCVRMSEPEERQFRFAWTYRPFKTKEQLIEDGVIDSTASLAEVKLAQVADMVAYAQSIYERRAAVIPHDFEMEIDGETYWVPGYYLAVAYSALKSQLPPQQGLTNYPLGGIVKKLHYSNDYFKPSQLKALSQGGVFVCLQDTEGAPIRSRFQVTTNMNNNKTKQISLVYSVDDYSMGYIATLKSLIGVNNVTPEILEEVELSTIAYASAKRNAGNIISAKLLMVRQNEDDESQVDVEQEVVFPTPLDRIVLRLRY